jgi:hypothetical protein
MITSGLKRTAARTRPQYRLVGVVGLVILVRSSVRVHRADSKQVAKTQRYNGIAYCIEFEDMHNLKVDVLRRRRLLAEIDHN